MTLTKDKLGKLIALKDLFRHIFGTYLARTIHDIVRENNVKDLELIVGRGASVNDVDIQNDDKFTPLHWAAHSGSLEVCKFLSIF